MSRLFAAPSDSPPVRYQGRICVRTGPRRAFANEQEERILNEKRRSKNIPFDIHRVPSAKVTDLSRVIFENEYLPAAFASDILEANHRSYEERLASCKFIVSPSDTIPTILGLLSIGKNPQDFLPRAAVQFLRIDGNELSDNVIDEAKIGGTLTQMLQKSEDKLNAHNRVAFDIKSEPTHIKTTPYPAEAIQQILYNAVFHRSYQGTNAPVRVIWFNDRIEIMSPGGPYGNVTPKNFGCEGITDYRNPNIGDVLKTFGFVQSFGRAISIAKAALKKNGNPDLVFNVDHDHVLAIIKATP